jgi:hypothetical protein
MAESGFRQAERPPPGQLRAPHGLTPLSDPSSESRRLAIAVAPRDCLRLAVPRRLYAQAVQGRVNPASTEQHRVASGSYLARSRVSGAGAGTGTISLACIPLRDRESIACGRGSVQLRASVDSWKPHRRAAGGRGGTTAHARVAAEPGDSRSPATSARTGAARPGHRRAFGATARCQPACSADRGPSRSWFIAPCRAPSGRVLSAAGSARGRPSQLATRRRTPASQQTRKNHAPG